MRTIGLLATIAGAFVFCAMTSGAAAAAEGLLASFAGDACGCDGGGCDDCGGCDECGNGCGAGCKRHCLGHWHRHRRIDGTDKAFNCGCNGSYKFPVPPLYTYHWPGMYSHQLMTDYHSPWRFPPLKPYVDEVAPQAMGMENGMLRRIQPVSSTVPASSPAGNAFSRHLELMSR